MHMITTFPSSEKRFRIFNEIEKLLRVWVGFIEKFNYHKRLILSRCHAIKNNAILLEC